MEARQSMLMTSSVPRGGAVVLSFLLVLLIAACAAPSATSPPVAATGDESPGSGEDPLAELYAAAQEEGALRVLGAADPEYMSPLFDAFNAAYPGIETEFVQHSPPDALQLLITTAAAGQQPAADVVLMKYQQIAPFYEDDGVDGSTDWVAYGVPEDVVMAIPGGVVEQAPPVGLAYNTEHVQPEDLPDTWQDLIDPKWNGVLSLDSNGSPWDLISPTWGADETTAFVEELVEVTNPVIIGGHTNGMLNLITGETHIRPAQFEGVLEFLAEGAPVAWHPLDPVILDKTAWWLLAGAENSSAGQLFIIWQATSEESQEIAREHFRPNTGTSQDAGIPAEYDIVAPASVEDYELSADVKAAIEPMLAGLGE